MVGAPQTGPADEPRKTERRSAQVLPPTPTQERGEVVVEHNSVVATFHLPELHPKDLGYHVGTRTLSLWSRRSGVDFRTILVLPMWVNPRQFLLSHKNGVYEFLMEAHRADALPA